MHRYLYDIDYINLELSKRRDKQSCKLDLYWTYTDIDYIYFELNKAWDISPGSGLRMAILSDNQPWRLTMYRKYYNVYTIGDRIPISAASHHRVSTYLPMEVSNRSSVRDMNVITTLVWLRYRGNPVIPYLLSVYLTLG
ncbi:hypothetical protein J6590_070508 [Homalodisca vitripennis]|nr:hypothetical protein J6590_070508 [Homalodisca vitripennis]